jgi:ParB/RepB/Spo0J family partition protein
MAAIVDLEGVSRANAYLIPAETLEQGENSRRWPDQDILELALDIVDRGQLVPVSVAWEKATTPNADDRLVVVDGNRRVAAIRYINENGLAVDGPLKVRCEQFKGEKFSASVAANLKRKGLTPIDLAHAITTLEKAGKPRKEIAKLLEISEALISRTLKLTTLPAAVQKDIHKGKIAASVGYEMAGDEGAAQTVAEESAAGEQPTVEKIRKVRREKAEKGEEVAGPKARSRKVVYNLFQEWAGCTDGTIEDEVKKFSAAMVEYMDGSCGDRKILNRLREMME